MIRDPGSNSLTFLSLHRGSFWTCSCWNHVPMSCNNALGHQFATAQKATWEEIWGNQPAKAPHSQNFQHKFVGFDDGIQRAARQQVSPPQLVSAGRFWTEKALRNVPRCLIVVLENGTGDTGVRALPRKSILRTGFCDPVVKTGREGPETW